MLGAFRPSHERRDEEKKGSPKRNEERLRLALANLGRLQCTAHPSAQFNIKVYVEVSFSNVLPCITLSSLTPSFLSGFSCAH